MPEPRRHWTRDTTGTPVAHTHDYRTLYNLGDNRYFRRCNCGDELDGWWDDDPAEDA